MALSQLSRHRALQAPSAAIMRHSLTATAAAVACCVCPPALAQMSATTPAMAAVNTAGNSASNSMPPPVAAQSVTITSRLATLPSTGGWDASTRETPVALTRIGSEEWQRAGAMRLADLLAFDSSSVDAYNAVGYYDQIAVRGFVVDNRTNIRRDGLPIQGETFIALDNKAAVEILKGTSGLQSGISAPGGLVNYIVARPLAGNGLRGSLKLQWTGRNSLLAVADVGARTEGEQRFAWRLHAAGESLKPELRNADGSRSLWALATEWRPTRSVLLELETESSRRSQPTQQAFSLLGARVPAVPDPRLNLNNQPWSLPTAFEGQTGSVRATAELSASWTAVLHAGRQALKTDDRLAFAYGKFDPLTYDCQPCDRFAPDGTFSVWDYRSENERRITDAAQAYLQGRFQAGGLQHRLRTGVLESRLRIRLQAQAYNLVGVGNIAGSGVLPSDPTPYDPNTDRTERGREWFVQDAIALGGASTAWVGVRHTQFDRASVRTDGSRRTRVADSLTTPWVGLSTEIGPSTLLYASRGEGAESQVVPNRPSQYTNAGQALPVLRSVQWEVGARGQLSAPGERLEWNTTAFHIRRPTSNLDACAALGISPCTGRNDGSVVHQGVELGAQWTTGPWWLHSQVTALQAERQGSTVQPELNGKAPTNVPERVARMRARYSPSQWNGVSVGAAWNWEAHRAALPDNSISIPAWSRWDMTVAGALPSWRAQWQVGIDNLSDRRYWREAPFQFGHAYLYPGAPRTFRASLLLNL